MTYQGALDLREVLVGTAKCSQCGDLHLQGLARLDDLRQASGVRPDGGEHRRVRAGLKQDRPLAVPDLDEPLHLEHDQRLTHRRAADAEPGSELALRR